LTLSLFGHTVTEIPKISKTGSKKLPKIAYSLKLLVSRTISARSEQKNRFMVSKWSFLKFVQGNQLPVIVIFSDYASKLQRNEKSQFQCSTKTCLL
jgi:hypothetical protein